MIAIERPLRLPVLPRADLPGELSIRCEDCCGLCCVALYRAQSEGFPADMPPGTPCKYLGPDFGCAVHLQLASRGLKGCSAFDCLGAGQKVTRLFSGKNWRSDPSVARSMFDAFLRVWRLHQMLWYLAETSALGPPPPLAAKISSCIGEVERLTWDAASLSEQAVEECRARVNPLLRLAAPVCANRRMPDGIGKNFKSARLDGKNFSGCLLIAANLSGCSLNGASFLGADLRDADLRGADLRKSLFLTQGQLNAAKGDAFTRLPAILKRPPSWENDGKEEKK